MVYVIMLIGIDIIEFILSISPKLTAMPETLEYTLPFQVTVVAYTKELERLWWCCYWRVYLLGHILFGLYSGASMNPARSLVPALLSGGMVENLWLYS